MLAPWSTRQPKINCMLWESSGCTAPWFSVSVMFLSCGLVRANGVVHVKKCSAARRPNHGSRSLCLTQTNEPALEAEEG